MNHNWLPRLAPEETLRTLTPIQLLILERSRARGAGYPQTTISKGIGFATMPDLDGNSGLDTDKSSEIS